MAQAGCRTERTVKVPERRSGFTLIELLVVIGIIALLATILMPSLRTARELARAAACTSNLHGLGSQLQVYQGANKSYFPSSYNYIDGNGSGGGYCNWSSLISDPEDYTADPTAGKYPKYANQFVCPSSVSGGGPPSNFTAGRIPNPPSGQAAQSATVDDRQAPRLSYTANEVIMPRKKYSPAHDADPASTANTKNLCLVSSDEIASSTSTILLGEFSSSANCIFGSSVGGGSAYKSHRPTNGIKIVGGGVFDGENYSLGTLVQKLTLTEAMTAVNAVLADKSVAATSHHISYINPNAHMNGSVYTFVDGHAAMYTLDETLNPNNYMWGRKVYSCTDKPVIQDN